MLTLIAVAAAAFGAWKARGYVDANRSTWPR